ncbi:bifunctional [glutamine synthetase] adenylyltransferase/[glutamine synthetase]-adenylyl-L-tyrosine phosphorylase [Georgenia sp. EYE_87]|uniref:bifunctional [glutamine synthetase] adenylyltransferase/[glutamine synthetase]-adenylyl-L-tyrosine phosphorylase n=1 Tax=Georgenia sp. EYE_87 TaxID=2853448 RepID=UPI0020049C49|nr:bifunctional [glutamine synthetase] adenylyltransferase/[glutamine synthetase]-adenylyl-L-tyrosine phosphorylase [Georgenia sp. EYE_87]MCK6209368.1 bifunctional [glutamine synthetase] adenylyltransferase/[glutamine synthetase]-adenylyl-L-tyrosine phosphorylase [Georgenia sp. EYE_87]
MTRPVSRTTTLRRLGFAEPATAAERLDAEVLAPYLAAADARGAPLPEALGRVADPDHALLTLLRLADSAAATEYEHHLAAILSDDAPGRRRLLAVLGASAALGDALVARPGAVALLAERPGERPVLDLAPEDERERALRAVGADPDAAVPVATMTGEQGVATLRRTYRRRLLEIAAADLTSPDPLDAFPKVAASIADIVAGALDAALAVVRADLPGGATGVRLAVLGMGKTGGRELNYISDVDVIYVVEPADGLPEPEAVRLGARLATALARAVSAVGPEPALWPLDANLRPEGKDGPLVRTLASHLAYYERWAKTWEFQALLKARPVAGDLALGRQYCEALAPMVWTAVERENFVEDSQAMRRRVEENMPAAEADRQLKLGRGGLRDVEFTVQLLQLVHGRTDDTIRSGTTLEGLAQLAGRGYVARDDAALLDRHYRFLRVLEHRMQLHKLRRTHVVPTAEEDLRRLGRGMGVDGVDGAATLEQRLRQVRREVRHLHEEIFYRPLLPATARLSADDVSLAPAAARARLSAIGYHDPDGAIRHIAALTEGISRSAAIQRHLLPVMLGWFAQGPLPDYGLLAFRKLSETMGTTHWYLKLLRDSGGAARRLARLLSTSRYVADALARLPEAVAWLDDDEELAPRTVEALAAELAALQDRRTDPVGRVMAARYLRRRGLLRAAIGDVLGLGDHTRSVLMITNAADIAVRGALRVAVDQALADAGLDEAPSRYLVVAMGRLGGREMGYASDADVLFVHEPLPGADPELATRTAVAVATGVRQLLGQTGAEPPLEVDADLRPEGRNGPLTRTLAAYAEYYERWVEPWERQSLLRARPVAGDVELGRRFEALVDPLRHPRGGLAEAEVRELRRIKARVESERMPRGVPPNRHLKLGRGGLSDVEWTVQLLQLRHAGDVPELRTTSTLDALGALHEAGIVPADAAGRLQEAWLLASRLRDAIVLGTGRATGQRADVLPHEPSELEVVARLLGLEPGRRLDLEEHWLRTSRRARAVVEELFYD